MSAANRCPRRKPARLGETKGTLLVRDVMDEGEKRAGERYLCLIARCCRREYVLEESDRVASRDEAVGRDD